jgi:transposase-like protein
VVVSFIGGENRSVQRKSSTCRKQEQLMEACKYSIETKASYREVSEKFGIPQSTLRDKLHAVEKLNAADVGRLSPGIIGGGTSV